MREIVRILFGSHLYGTNTPESDWDFKSIHVPAPRDILLQRVKGSICTQRPKSSGEKNNAGDVDTESYSLQRFLGLVAEGQTVAMDVLFAPDWALIGDTSEEWDVIAANRHRLLTRRSASFVGYARTQANKYGIKGSRVAAARAALAMLDEASGDFGGATRLHAAKDAISEFVLAHEHAAIVSYVEPNGRATLMLEVCNKKMPFTASINNARDVMARVVDEYGKRALMAEKQDGIDWKALSHAVRVGRQAVELLSTAHITFPLSYADHIMAIKAGGLEYKDVAAEIEGLLDEVEAAAAASTLPDAPDFEWIDDFVANTYRAEICG